MNKTAKDIMSKKVISASCEDTISATIAKMDQHGIKEMPVVNEIGELQGMVTYYDILDGIRADPSEKIKTITIVPHTITPLTDIPEIARLMLSTGLEALPVVEGGKMIGIVSDFDVVNEIQNYDEIKSLTVGETMRPLETVLHKDDTIASARRLMRFHTADRIPVVDSENRPLGMILSFDILSKFLVSSRERMNTGDFTGEKHSLFSMPVSSVMNVSIPSLKDTETIPEAFKKLKAAATKGSYVVDENNKVVGVFYRWDLLEKITEKGFEEGVWLRFSGMPLKTDLVEILKEYLTSEIKRIKRLEPDAQEINIHIRKMHGATDDKWNYEVDVALNSNNGSKEIFNKGCKGKYGYNLMYTISDALQKLEAQLEKSKGKKVDTERSKKK